MGPVAFPSSLSPPARCPEHELRAAFERVLAGSAFILGEEVAHFEEEFAPTAGASLRGSGLRYRGADPRPPGDGNRPRRRGDRPRPHLHCVSARGLARRRHANLLRRRGGDRPFCRRGAAAVTPQTAAILPVHLYGQCCDMDAVSALADQHGLAILEDAAQAHGATYRGRRAGSLGTSAAFSFYPSKNLGALGDGGAICTDHDDIARRARSLRDLGRAHKDRHELAGYNERLDGLQAAFLRVKLPPWIRGTRRGAGTRPAYRELLADGSDCSRSGPRVPPIYHLFPIRVEDRDALAASLADAGIQTGVHYLSDRSRSAAVCWQRRRVPERPSWADETCPCRCSST